MLWNLKANERDMGKIERRLDKHYIFGENWNMQKITKNDLLSEGCPAQFRFTSPNVYFRLSFRWYMPQTSQTYGGDTMLILSFVHQFCPLLYFTPILLQILLNSTFLAFLIVLFYQIGASPWNFAHMWHR